MTPKLLDQMHPKDASAAGIAASIERMQAALIEIRGEIAALEGTRRGVLVSGSNSDVEKHDARIRGLRLDVERIEAAIETLRPDLAIARGRERLAHLEEKRLAAVEARQAFLDFWRDEYEPLARAIAAGLALEEEAASASWRYDMAAAEATRDPSVVAAGGVPAACLPDAPVGYVGLQGKAPTTLTCLPAIEPGSPLYWPRGHRLEPITLTGEAAAYAR